ncbi:MAG: MgtC/SapB family protein [Clostridia bacterium]|nr:MgtC/SapB family protein [Clostridia bacterium]
MEQILEQIQSFFALHPILTYLVRILAATLCGAIIGLERTRRSKEAGIRTHCIIACAAALIMILSKYGFSDLLTAEGFAEGTRGADPSRIAAQVITGISFLGAGVIFKNGNTVKGLTTAAGIWAMAAIGMACGAGMYSIAFAVTFVILGVQLVMHRFSVGNDAYSNSEIRMTIIDTPEIRKALLKKQEELGITVINSRITACGDNTLNMILQVRLKTKIPFDEVVKFMDEHPEVKSLSV